MHTPTSIKKNIRRDLYIGCRLAVALQIAFKYALLQTA